MEKKTFKGLPLNLQLFAGEGGEGGGDGGGQTPTLSAENVTAFLSENPAVLGELLKQDFAKPVIQPLTDSHFSKSLETWKANNLDKIVNERVEALFPNETPQAKQMRELQAQIDRINGEKQQAVMNSFTTQALVQEGLDTSFARFLQGQDEATTRANISDFKHAFTSALNGTVDSKFKQFGHQPQVNQTQQTEKVDPNTMSYADRMALYNSNPNEYNRLFK
jgi:hypothetical protein